MKLQTGLIALVREAGFKRYVQCVLWGAQSAPRHQQIPGEIERWHQTLKNRILYYLLGELQASIGMFVDHYNHQCYHEILNNLTPADV